MNTARRHLVVAAACAVLPALAGCGYSFSGSSLPSHLKTIAIPVFENESLDATIADEVTQGVLSRFLADNRLKVVREGRADCVLEGKVTRYERRVYSYTPAQEPREYIVSVGVAVVLKDRVKNKDLWRGENLQGGATYGAVAGDEAGQVDTEEEARAKAIEEIAQDILAKSLEQW